MTMCDWTHNALHGRLDCDNEATHRMVIKRHGAAMPAEDRALCEAHVAVNAAQRAGYDMTITALDAHVDRDELPMYSDALDRVGGIPIEEYDR